MIVKAYQVLFSLITIVMASDDNCQSTIDQYAFFYDFGGGITSCFKGYRSVTPQTWTNAFQECKKNAAAFSNPSRRGRLAHVVSSAIRSANRDNYPGIPQVYCAARTSGSDGTVKSSYRWWDEDLNGDIVETSQAVDFSLLGNPSLSGSSKKCIGLLYSAPAVTSYDCSDTKKFYCEYTTAPLVRPSCITFTKNVGQKLNSAFSAQSGTNTASECGQACSKHATCMAYSWKESNKECIIDTTGSPSTIADSNYETFKV